MALLKFISLSVGSLMLFQGAHAGAPEAVANATCVTAMNEARQQVSLPTFNTPSTQAFSADNIAKSAAAICTWLQPSDAESLSDALGTNATAAYQVQATANCTEAVTSWKAGFSAYGNYTHSVPPKFEPSSSPEGTQLGTAAPYNTEAAINFAALYNGNNTASAECAFVTCQQNIQADVATAMVCLTYPPALTAGAEPWTKDQWDKILAVFSPSSSSASAAVPTLLALVAVAAGVALM